jgi:hypothetical protein
MIFLQSPLSLLLSCSVSDASCPPESLLSVVNSVLCGTYKPDAKLMSVSLQLLQKIREVIVVSSSSNVLHILESLRAGLQLWIEDEKELLAENVFNSVVCRVFVSRMACSPCIGHVIILGHARCAGTTSPQHRLSAFSGILFGCWVFSHSFTRPRTFCV